MNKNTRIQSTAGFTLMEWLVVAAIMGLLVVVAVSNFRNFYENSQVTVNQADLKAANSMVELFRVRNSSSPLLTGSNDLPQHTALLTAMRAMPENPYRNYVFDPTKFESVGSGASFRFTKYQSGTAALAATLPTDPGTPPTGSSLNSAQVVLNGIGITQISGSGSNALAAYATVSLTSGTRMIVGIGGEQVVYELADTTGPELLPDLVQPADFGAGNQRMWRRRFMQDTLRASNNLSEVANKPAAQANLGLKTMATQDASAVAITGGSVSLPNGAFSLGTQINTSATAMQLSGKIDGALRSSTTFIPDGSTLGGGVTFSGARDYSLFSTSAGAPLGAEYLVIADLTSGFYRVVIDRRGRVALGGTYAPTSALTIKSDGSSPILTLLNSGGTPVFTTAFNGATSIDSLSVTNLTLPAITSAAVLGTDASGNVVSGTVTADARYVQKAGDTMTGNLLLQGDAYTLYGPNSTWGASLRVGGNGNVGTTASVATTNGNLHLDAATGAFATYLNYYRGTGGTIFGNGAGGTVGSVDSAGNLTMNGTGTFAGVVKSGGSDVWTKATLTNLNQLANGPGYITGITSGMVTTALGFTPVNRAGDTLAGNFDLQQGNYFRIYHAAQTDANDGKIGAGLFASGLNIVGVQTAAGLGRQIRLWGTLLDSGGATYWNSSNLTNLNQLANGPGYITGINSSMVTAALGYTPANRAGDTFTGLLTAGANLVVNTAGTGAASRTMTIKDASQSVITYGAYPGTWTSAFGIQSNDNSRFLWFSPLDTTSGANARMMAAGTGLDIFTGGSASSNGTLAFSIASGGAVSVPVSLSVAGNTVLNAGNFNSYSPTLTGGGASGTWGINITGSAGSVAWGNVTGKPSTLAGFGITDFISSNSGNPFAANSATTNGVYYTNADISLFGQSDGALWVQGYSSSWVAQQYQDYRTGQLALRGKNSGTWQGWRTVLDSGNFTGYAPSLTGTGASGTWGISVSGNSATTSQRTFGNVRTDGINRGSYGSISVAGSNNTYAGIDFTDASATLMVRTSDQYSGLYKNNNTWVWAFDGSGSLVAGSVPWGNVSGRPSISGTWTYSGQSGQPTWLWGTNDGSSMYVWNPANFVVAGAYAMPISDGTSMNPGLASTIAASGSRSVSLAPNTYKHGIFAEFKDGSFASMGGNYGGLLTVAPYDGTSASTGDPSYQVLFSPAGANSTSAPTLRVRAGVDTTWGGWSTLLHSSNFNSYAPSLTGTGASGTWGINVSGTASNVTNLTGTWDGINYFRSNKGSGATIGGTNTYSLQAYSTDGGPAGMSFHRSGYYAVNMGLDADNYLRIGGWSAAANRWQLNLATGDQYVAGNYYANGNLVLNTANYNSYAPTLTGGNASGTWPIAITGASGNSYYLISQDTRNSNYLPSDRNAGLYADFKANATDGLSDGGTYHGVMTFRPYGVGTDFSGGQATQLAVSDNGNLWMRTSTGSGSWSAWKQPGGGTPLAAPTATIGLTAVPGSATSAMRSDAAPALSQAIVPTWTGLHTFSPTNNASAPSASNAGIVIAATVAQSGNADFRDLVIKRTNTSMGSGSQYLIDAQVANVSKFNVDTTGKVNATSLNTTSSIRFKNNPQALRQGLETVLKLRPVSYDWKPGFGKGGHDIGFIAEEVQQVVPEIVATNAAGEVEGMDYSRVTAILTSAVQELKTRDDERLAKLERRLARQSAIMWTAVVLASIMVAIGAGAWVVSRRESKGF